MNSIDRLEAFLRAEITRLDHDIQDMRRRASEANFDDLRDGLSQRADDLAEEADQLMEIWNRLPNQKSEVRR